MNKLSMLLFASLALAGCKKKASGDDCANVIPAAVDRVMPEMQKEMGGAMPADKVTAMGTKMKDVLIKRCTEDKWSADYLKCLGNGKTSADMETCDKTLPKDQKEKLDKDLGDAMKDMMGDMAGSGSADMAGSGSAAAGSGDMAGSGSAH